jgi:hypothetical protein
MSWWHDVLIAYMKLDEVALLLVTIFFFVGVNLGVSFMHLETRYSTGAPLFSAFLLLGIALCVGLFWKQYEQYMHQMSRCGLLGFFAATAVVFGLYGFFPSLSIQDPHAVEPQEIIPALFLMPKWFDIILQQLCLLVAVQLLQERTGSVKKTVLWTMLCSLIFHGVLFVHHELWFALTATTAALAAAVLFPVLLLTVRNGVLYTYMLHWSFYVTLALIF